jgi:cytochrome P450
MSTVDEIFRHQEQSSAKQPVRFTEPLGAWIVSGHADVDRVLTDHVTFSSDELRYSTQPVPHRDNPVLHSLMAMDPPRHHVLRRIVSRAFTPKATDALESAITSTMRELLDGAGSTFDVIDEIAYPLSVHTIASLLGVQPERRPDFVRWTEAITSFAGSFAAAEHRQTAFRQAVTELGEYFRAEFAQHRQGDVISTLLAAEPDGTRLTEEELVNFCALLLINGHETTKTLLANAVLCVADRTSELRADMLPGAIEEVLRYLPPTGGTDRFTTVPTTLGGHEIRAGQRVIVMISAANRDPDVFPDPQRFDIRRDPNPHLSFGRGVHFCLGAHLARREVRIALQALLNRIDGCWHIPHLVTDRTPVGIDVLELTLAGNG